MYKGLLPQNVPSELHNIHGSLQVEAVLYHEYFSTPRTCIHKEHCPWTLHALDTHLRHVQEEYLLKTDPCMPPISPGPNVPPRPKFPGANAHTVSRQVPQTRGSLSVFSSLWYLSVFHGLLPSCCAKAMLSCRVNAARSGMQNSLPQDTSKLQNTCFQQVLAVISRPATWLDKISDQLHLGEMVPPDDRIQDG